MTIETRIESARGCGYRKPGGKYLMGGGAGFPCGKLPIPLDYCPCCGGGIKFSRGFQWMSGEFLTERECKNGNTISQGGRCLDCQPFRGCEEGTIKKLGLLWVGEKFYPTPADYLSESKSMGISKRISAIPKNLILGETWVMLAHKKAIATLPEGSDEMTYGPGIFSMFLPTHLEYVVREKNGKVIDGKKKLAALEKRGFKLVRVQHA